MGAMVGTLLGLLGLLLAPAGASEEGDVCLGWLPISVEGLQPFHCPERPDGTDGPFCCGTCTEPYCCDSKEARLDQDQCLQTWLALQVLVRTAMTQRPTLPVLQNVPTPSTSEPQTRGAETGPGDATPTSWSLSKRELTEAVLIGIACAILLFLILYLIMCKCCPGIWGPEPSRQDGRGEDSPSDSPTPQLEILDFNPRFEEIAPLVRHVQADLSSSWAAPGGQDTGVTAVPRRRAFTAPNILYTCPATPTATQAPTTSADTPETSPSGEPAATGEVIPVQGAATSVNVTPESGAAAAGEMTPGPGAAVGGENPPEQGADGGGEASAEGDPAGGGEGASPLVSPAPGVISA